MQRRAGRGGGKCVEKSGEGGGKCVEKGGVWRGNRVGRVVRERRRDKEGKEEEGRVTNAEGGRERE